MKGLAVDLRSHSSPPKWAWILAMVAVCAASAMVLAAQLQSHMLQALKSEYAFRAHRINTLPNLPMPVSQTFPYDVSARELLMLATSKWPDMLAALESVEIAGVTPIGLEIAPAERRIWIETEFADYPSLLRFIDGLNAGEPVQKWSLVQAQGANRPSSAVVTAPFTAVIRGEW